MHVFMELNGINVMELNGINVMELNGINVMELNGTDAWHFSYVIPTLTCFEASTGIAWRDWYYFDIQQWTR